MRGDAKAGRVTEDAVLGGRLTLQQPARGHRFGHDAILLAASCPARPGERTVDRAAGLALAARVAGVHVTLVELDPNLVALAAENAQRNGLAARVHAVELDVVAPARVFTAAGLAPDSVEQVLMNPPFNDAAKQRGSPDPGRRLAHEAPAALLKAWTKTAARLLRPGGTLSLIWRADGLADVLAALATCFGAVKVVPIHPKLGEPAIRVIVRATKGSRAPLALLPGFVLNDESGQPTAAAEAVLRTGSALPVAEL
jgi:tRNA1(Val) A37 N6-methylase TrmN6